MKRDGLIPWYWEWNKAGKLIRVLYHTPEEHRRINAGLPSNPAPEPAEKPKIERGVRAMPKADQGSLL